MRTNILTIILLSSLTIIGCNSHDHANCEDDHNHTEEQECSSAETEPCSDEEHAGEIVFTQKQAEASGVKTETVNKSTFFNVIKTSGKIQSPQGEEEIIVATTNGIVTFANSSITDGTAIKTGETIVTISAKNIQDGDPSLKSKYTFEAAEKEYNRAEELVKDKIISPKEFEQIALRYKTAKTAWDAQSKNLTASGTKITSKKGGFIKNLMVTQGQYVSIGEPIATITQNRRLQLRAEVSEKNYKHLKNINNANFKTTYDNKTYKLSDLNGKLISYGKSSNESSFYIPITFEFDNVGDIFTGAFTEVFLLSTPREEVISLPISAITEEQGINFIYKQIEDEAFIKQEIKLGQNNGERVEILSGLNAGDKIAITGVYQIKLASMSGEIPHGHEH